MSLAASLFLRQLLPQVLLLLAADLAQARQRLRLAQALLRLLESTQDLPERLSLMAGR
jgi:hypothetical protein